MSWKRSSVKRQPTWQSTQPALPVNRRKPRTSAALSALDRRRSRRRSASAARPASARRTPSASTTAASRDGVPLFRESALRTRAVSSELACEPGQDRRPIAAHLVGGLDRRPHLRFQRRGAAVPEIGFAPGEVPERGRVAAQVAARQCAGAAPPVGEGARRDVAGGAGALAVARQTRVGEQPGTERDPRRRCRLPGGAGGGVAGRWIACARRCLSPAPARATARNKASPGVRLAVAASVGRTPSAPSR